MMDSTQELQVIKTEIDRLQQRRDVLLRQIADEKGVAYAMERLFTLRNMLDNLDLSHKGTRMTRGVEVHIKLRHVHEDIEELKANGKDTTEAKALLEDLTRRVLLEVFLLNPSSSLLTPKGL